MHYSGGCHICGACSEPGWLKIDAIATGICRCSIETLVSAAPHIARAVLEATTSHDQGGQT